VGGTGCNIAAQPVNVVSATRVEQLVAQMEFACSNAVKGCEWRGGFADIATHMG
jgi:hypothetical protein